MVGICARTMLELEYHLIWEAEPHAATVAYSAGWRKGVGRLAAASDHGRRVKARHAHGMGSSGAAVFTGGV